MAQKNEITIFGAVSTFGLAIILLLLISPALAGANSNNDTSMNIPEPEISHKVLIIHSYYPTYDWTNEITTGIVEAFAESECHNSEISIEYMDTKRYPEPEYRESLLDIYRYRYADSNQIDIIIAADNYAIDLVCSKEGVEIFGNTPVVFLGANSIDPTWKENRPLLTGVREDNSLEATVELILDVHPKAKKIMIVGENNSLTGEIIQSDAMERLEPYRDLIEIEEIGKVNETELKQKLSSLSDDTIVLELLFLRDRDGKVYSVTESNRVIGQNSNVPVYVLWNMKIGHGAVGGKVLNGEHEGRLAADMALRILEGEDIRNIPILEGQHNEYIFDGNALKEHSIPKTALPDESIIINQNLSFVDKYRTETAAMFLVLFIQSIFLVSLVINRNYLKRTEAKLIVAKEKAEKSDHLKTHFLANVSHEIRTPMNAILGFSEMLRNYDVKPEKKAHYIELINDSGKNLLAIINDILDISKIGAEKLELFNKSVSLNELISSLDEQYNSEIKSAKKDIILSSNCDKEELWICVDEIRLEQVLKNLLSNSLKFTEKGLIEFGYTLPDSEHIEFYVKDTGIGIPENMQKAVFEQFQQINYDYAREYQGTGLGLAISKALVELMGGQIRVESSEDIGSSFYFVLPLVREENIGGV